MKRDVSLVSLYDSFTARLKWEIPLRDVCRREIDPAWERPPIRRLYACVLRDVRIGEQSVAFPRACLHV